MRRISARTPACLLYTSREDFKSDIYVGLGARELGVWTSPGDYGARRGRFNPSWWSDTSSQYGLLKTWRIDSLGCTLDGEPLSSVTVADLQLDALEYIPLRIGIHADAAHVGGINLFGEKFGDFAQGIVVRVGYAKADCFCRQMSKIRKNFKNMKFPPGSSRLILIRS